MNEKPHTHEPDLHWSYGKSRWVLKYGDTQVIASRLSKAPSPRKVKKALAKAVRLHDEGSRRAGEKEARIAAAKEAAVLPVTDQAWGEDLLSGKVALVEQEPQESVQDRNKRLREEQWKKEYEAQRAVDKARDLKIQLLRAEHWKQGTPDKKVQVDGYGRVQEFEPQTPPYLEIVGEGSEDSPMWYSTNYSTNY